MLNRADFIRKSLELNLFFARIIREHLTFMEASFTVKDADLAGEACQLKMQLNSLLAEVIALSRGVIKPDLSTSGEYVTPFTLKAELATQYYTGIYIDTGVTQAEIALTGSFNAVYTPLLEQRVFMLNQKMIEYVNIVIQFKTKVFSDVASCKAFTSVYPSMLEHLIMEAKFYIGMLTRLQQHEAINLEKEALQNEMFWNHIMGDHAKFIRGLLDPSEEALIKTANIFSNEFDELTKKVKEAAKEMGSLVKVTEESLKATTELRDFKVQGTQGLLECKIRAIILPLLSDHVLREANYYLKLLKKTLKR
ncbi:MAG: DUF2935 domain-containing protein [Clostridia bacterium]|nr:DUF2935 domain-containing protein [Clostridia bacterium]